MGAFQLWHRGISGASRHGADAIIVSGKREGMDNGHQLLYVAEWRIGANALWKSYVDNRQIRVFRSLSYERNGMTTFSESTGKDDWRRQCGLSSYNRRYRYGGLYRIARAEPPGHEKGTFRFYLVKEHPDSECTSALHQMVPADLKGKLAETCDEEGLALAGRLLSLSSITNLSPTRAAEWLWQMSEVRRAMLQLLKLSHAELLLNGPSKSPQMCAGWDNYQSNSAFHQQSPLFYDINGQAAFSRLPPPCSDNFDQQQQLFRVRARIWPGCGNSPSSRPATRHKWTVKRQKTNSNASRTVACHDNTLEKRILSSVRKRNDSIESIGANITRRHCGKRSRVDHDSDSSEDFPISQMLAAKAT
jgi:hypothetical protein